MLKDITIGQYFPGKSIVHRLDSRFKIVIMLCYIVMLFMGKQVYSMIFGILFCILAWALSRIPIKLICKSLKPIIPILIITALLDILFITDGKSYFEMGFLKITEKGVMTGIQMIIRITFLIIGTSLLTYTTSPIALTDAIERLLSPLKKVKFPVHAFAMMMTIALRFIPTLIEETDKIISAQKARGADMESGSLIHRAKALIPIFVPLFVSAFRRAEELATAMECRCYRGDIGRTKMKQLHAGKADFIAAFFTIIFFGAAISINVVF